MILFMLKLKRAPAVCGAAPERLFIMFYHHKGIQEGSFESTNA